MTLDARQLFAQHRFGDSLQAITVAIEIIASIKSQRLCTVNQTLHMISDYLPQVINDCQELTAIVDEFFISQLSQPNPPQS